MQPPLDFWGPLMHQGKLYSHLVFWEYFYIKLHLLMSTNPKNYIQFLSHGDFFHYIQALCFL